MHKNIFQAIALCGCGVTIKAQQDNIKLRYTSNKTQSLDALKKVNGTTDEKVTVEVTKTGISIMPANKPGEVLTGELKDVSCLWKEAFAAGKTIISTTLHSVQGDIEDAVITIEGADGKITILLETEDYPAHTLRLLVDRHEELN